MTYLWDNVGHIYYLRALLRLARDEIIMGLSETPTSPPARELVYEYELALVGR